MNAQLASVMEGREDYTVIFTGHSMGAAVSYVACLDAILEGTINGRNTMVYNFGQPRVANKEYGDFSDAHISETYRIVHDHDIWVHVPPCIENLISVKHFRECLPTGNLPFYPWQEGSEVLYDQHFTEFKVCNDAESMDCSNGMNLYNKKDHSIYMNINFQESWK